MSKRTLITIIMGLTLGSLFVLFVVPHLGAHISASSVEDTIGPIDAPPGVDYQNARAGLTDPNDVAIFFFLSNLLKVVNVIAGVWVAFNIVLAAFNYLSGQGSPDAHKKVRDKLTMSVVGLFILVIAYAAVAMLSMLFFGDASYILRPTL